MDGCNVTDNPVTDAALKHDLIAHASRRSNPT